MAVESAGEARAKITADTSGLKKATAEVKSSEGKIVGSMKKIEAAAMMAMGQQMARAGKQMTAALASAVKGPVAYADAIDKMSETTGISRTRLQEWNVAATLSGSSVDDMNRGVAFLSKLLEQAAQGEQTYIDTLVAYGITATTVEEAIWQINAAMAAETDSGRRLAMAQELLGRGGKALVPMFKQTRESIEGMFATAREGGMIISDDEIARTVALQDAMGLLGIKTKATAALLANELGPAFVAMENIEQDILAGIVNKLKDMGTFGDVAAIGIAGVGKALSLIGNSLWTIAALNILLGKNIFLLSLAKVKTIALAIASGVAAAWQWIWNAALAVKLAMLGAFVLVAAGVAAGIYMSSQAATGPAVPAMAQGGIVTRPTLVMAGERGPEAIVPLGGSRFGRTRITININGITDPSAVADAVARELQNV